MKRSQLVKLVKEELNKKQTANENLDDILSRFIQTDDSSELKAYIKGLPDMARNKLAKIFKIELDEEVGYSKYAPGGTTQGGTTKDFMNILTKIAKGKADKYQGDPQKGHKILDKANPENVARILKGEKPIYEQGLQQVDKKQAIKYLQSKDAKRYNIGVSRGVSQRFTDKQQALDTLADSRYNTFEILDQGETITVYIPADAEFVKMVRSMGPLD